MEQRPWREKNDLNKHFPRSGRDGQSRLIRLAWEFQKDRKKRRVLAVRPRWGKGSRISGQTKGEVEWQ
jgi:hypothetical protein